MSKANDLINELRECYPASKEPSFSIDENGEINEGYTQYWTFHVVHAPSYKSALKDIRNMIKKEGKGVLAGGDGTGQPELKNGVSFNGIGELSHETFFLPNSTPKKGTFEFCKTMEKPYDKFVSASLLILKDWLGSAITIETDGRDFKNGQSLAKKYSTMVGEPIAKIAKMSKQDKALKALAEMGEPNFNDNTVSLFISEQSYLGGPNAYKLVGRFSITKERNDLMRDAKLDGSSMSSAFDKYVAKRFGYVYGRKEFKKDKASKGLVGYTFSILIQDPKLAYGLGANLGYAKGNTISKNPNEVAKKMQMYDDMINQLDNYREKARTEISLRTQDKEKHNEIWRNEYMDGYTKMRDKFEERGFTYPYN